MAKKYRVIKKPVAAGSKKNEYRKEKGEKIPEMEPNRVKPIEGSLEGVMISDDIEINYSNIRTVFKNCYDLVLRSFTAGDKPLKCFLAYIDGMVDKAVINLNILKSMMSDGRTDSVQAEAGMEGQAEVLKNTTISNSDVKTVNLLKDAVDHILHAHCVVFIDKNTTALAVSVKGWKDRNVSQPVSEVVVRGPIEGFVEDIRVNTVLIRRRLKIPELKMEKLEMGTLGKTEVVMAYIGGIAENGTVDEVRKRLSRIDIDVIIDSSYIEQLIEDSPFSPFPQVEATERPDVVAAALAEGRIAVLSDGSPFALLVPTVFIHLMSASEDYYVRSYFASFIRIFRYMAFAIALLGPSIYIALTTYHQEMIPTLLLITIASSRAEIPFPAFFEALLMEITFEMLREAGLRLPRPVGPAVSIVGGLVIGQGAVQAGIVSQAMIIVVAITGIASFALPRFNLSNVIRYLRFPMMILAATMGIFGIIMGILALLIHMAGLRSIGVPYLSPLAPISLQDIKDMIFRLPLWYMNKRSTFIQKNNTTRMKKGLRPRPPSRGD